MLLIYKDVSLFSLQKEIIPIKFEQSSFSADLMKINIILYLAFLLQRNIRFIIKGKHQLNEIVLYLLISLIDGLFLFFFLLFYLLDLRKRGGGGGEEEEKECR